MSPLALHGDPEQGWGAAKGAGEGHEGGEETVGTLEARRRAPLRRGCNWVRSC